MPKTEFVKSEDPQGVTLYVLDPWTPLFGTHLGYKDLDLVLGALVKSEALGSGEDFTLTLNLA